jgi:hypothetical protein
VRPPRILNSDDALRQLRFHPRVDTLDEGDGGGVSVVLKRGWSFAADADRRTSRFSTPVRVLGLVRDALPFYGPFADDEAAPGP